MRIKSIELTNIRCFEHIKVEFGRDGQVAPWTVILGDNGTGKSTLLRCVALALTPRSQLQPMIVETGGEWIREGATHGTIRVQFDNDERRILRIDRETGSEVIIDAQGTFSDSSRDKVFVCGYGAARRSFGDQGYRRYSVREATATLFNYDTKLQNPELILRRISDQNGGPEEVLALVDRVLMLSEGSTRLGLEGLEIRGPWGEYKPVGSLGDGFRATLAWILDLIGWAAYYDYEMLRTRIEGIALVDEIEQHLHPRWQRRILGLLHQQFPAIQFIVTTHSSLCVVGTTDFEDDDIALTLLLQGIEGVNASNGLKPPRGYRADQILTSPLFGLETTSDDGTKFEVERLSKLLSLNQPTPGQVAEIARLRKSLNLRLGSEETALERDVTKAVTEVLQQPGRFAREHPAADEVIDLEVRRQLQELFSDQ